MRPLSPRASAAVALLLLTAAGAALSSAPARAFWSDSAAGVGAPRLTGISSRLDGRTASVLIEVSEPVAYVTSQPDPLTVLVDLRNVSNVASRGIGSRVTGTPPPVAGIFIEDATAADGEALARVRVTLAHAAAHRVRSAHNLIFVDIDRARPRAGGDASATPEALPNPEALPKKSLPARLGLEGLAQRADSAAAAQTPQSPALPVADAGSPEGGAKPKGAAEDVAPAITPTFATVLRKVTATSEAQGPVITLTGNGPLAASTVEEARDLPPRIVLDFPGVSSSAPAITTVSLGPVQRVRVATKSRSPLVTRVVIDLSRHAAYRVEPPEDGNNFRVIFDLGATVGPDGPARPGGAANAANIDPMSALQLVGSQPAPEAEPARSVRLKPDATTSIQADPVRVKPDVTASTQADAVRLKPDATTSIQADPVRVKPDATASTQADPVRLKPDTATAAHTAAQASGAPQQPPIAAQGAQPATIGRGERQFTGHPISLDFQGADLRAVLRTFAEISGLNVVIDPAVQGSVDVALRDVPWDQALDIILRASKLGYMVDGTIVRIAPLNVLAEEEALRRKLADEQRLAGELRVITRTISYAKAEDLKALLTQTVLTSRGTVQVDPRTNTLIISDLPNKLTEAADLIRALDQAQPQVEIEARIVTTTREFARQLGVQWGFTGRMTQDLANTTGLAFPNTGSLTGRTGTSQGPPGVLTDTSATAVNLGVDGPSSALGLAMGSVNGSVNLDVALSALERAGQGRLLSTPRVSTQNNVQAEITQGVQIPIQTVANNTVTVTFKDAALTLKVTPQITAVGTVIMKIEVENASPDFSRSIRDIPPIDTQRAITQVLVSDGQTTVIGGIYVSREQATNDRTPGLHRLPLLGWLFKRESVRDESRELLIFITPRIIKT